MVYDPEIISALVGMLQKLSTSRADRKAPEVFIASTIRNPDTYQLFQAELGGCLLFKFYLFASFPITCSVVERSRSPVQEQDLIPELDLRAVDCFAHGFHQEGGTPLAITAHICEGSFVTLVPIGK